LKQCEDFQEELEAKLRKIAKIKERVKATIGTASRKHSYLAESLDQQHGDAIAALRYDFQSKLRGKREALSEAVRSQIEHFQSD
jgi:hypothetical protein